MASVTVIIPTYNSVPFLEETVKSALFQTDPPESIIIVDDGSPDESYALAQTLAVSHPTLKAVQRKNGGAGAARNTGLALAETDFVLFLDADDRLLPKAISLNLAELEREPEAVMVFGANHCIDQNGSYFRSNFVTEQTVTLEDLAMYVTPCPSQCIYRRDALQQVGGFNETLRPGDEIDLNMRLISIGPIRSHSGFVMEYRHHPNQGIKNVYSNSAGHLKALSLNLGPNGITPSATLYRRSRRKWLARYGYGQHISALGALRHGRWQEIWPATKLATLGLWARLVGAKYTPPQR